MTEPHVAGHSTHFLRRLDRARDEQVELALALYNDAELLREVLARAGLPEGAERIAISLADPVAGPFVVVTRDGKFVTLLGEGMTTEGLHRVSRERIDVAASHVERMRERIAASRALAADTGQASVLWERVQKAGPPLAREDFSALARWEPLLGHDFMVAATEADAKVASTFSYLRTLRTDKLTASDEALLERWYNAFWAGSHAFVLMHTGDARARVTAVSETLPVDERGLDGRFHLIVDAMRYGVLGPSVRSLWAAARHGKALLPPVKRMPISQSLQGRGMRDLSLAAIAHGTSKARAEVVSALERAPKGQPSAFDIDWHAKVTKQLLADLLRPLEEALAAAERELDRMGDPETLNAPRGLPTELLVDGRLPTDVSLAMLATSGESWIKKSGYAVHLGRLVPRIAHARPEELFLPRSWFRHGVVPYETKYGVALLEGMTALFGVTRATTVTSAPVPGRNDPCSCGSGKKYKRCCG